MQTDLGDKTPVKGHMLVDKYSAFSGKLYAAAGTAVFLVTYRGTVVIVETEEGNRFAAKNDEAFFGNLTQVITPSSPVEIPPAPGPKRKKAGRHIEIDQTPTLF